MSIDALGRELAAAITAYGATSPRTLQSTNGILGPSDLGFCRQKATLTTKGVARTDVRPMIAAQIGTAIHEYVAKAFAAANPEWITDNLRVTAKFPSGAEISGTPDLICPNYNALIDVKTVDGFSWVKREGTSQNHKFQRHTYTLGAIQEGLLDSTRTVYVGNLYIDRSGKEKEPYFVVEEYDPTLTDEIDSWITDVTYAVKTREDAARDIPAPICEKICDFYTVCRGGLPIEEGITLIEDNDTKAAIRMYVEGRDMEKEGSQLKKEAATLLYGINGTDGEWQVRWTTIGESQIAAYNRASSERLDVRRMKSPK